MADLGDHDGAVSVITMARYEQLGSIGATAQF